MADVRVPKHVETGQHKAVGRRHWISAIVRADQPSPRPFRPTTPPLSHPTLDQEVVHRRSLLRLPALVSAIQFTIIIDVLLRTDLISASSTA